MGTSDLLYFGIENASISMISPAISVLFKLNIILSHKYMWNKYAMSSAISSIFLNLKEIRKYKDTLSGFSQIMLIPLTNGQATLSKQLTNNY